MSGSQHNPNGRQSQLGSGWSPLQMQMANLLARAAPQAHMGGERGHTWHTPTPPPHLYHVPVPSPPDPLQGLQAMKAAGGNSVFRHTATPPELYRHTPTPPEKHLMRHTPSPGDVKGPSVDIYPHLGPARDKLMRAEELLSSYARQGVDLSLGSRANGAAPAPPAPAPAPPAPAPPPALSVRDAPTINSLIARAAPRRVDSLLERLVPSPHSVIVHSRAANTPSPPSSNEDSADSCGAPPGSKRKRKPERTVRVPLAPPPPPALPAPTPTPTPIPTPTPTPLENGDVQHTNGPDECAEPAEQTHTSPKDTPTVNDESARRKTRSGSSETIADIAAMIATGEAAPPALSTPAPPALSVDKLQSVLGSPEPEPEPEPEPASNTTDTEHTPSRGVVAGAGGSGSGVGAAAPRRRSLRATSEACVASPSEARGADVAPPAEPAAASFVEVENQLEKMFAGLEEPHRAGQSSKDPAPASKRRKSAPGRGRTDSLSRRKGPRKKPDAKPRKQKDLHKEATRDNDSGSNASSGKSRGPYIQIRGNRADGSPISVSVMNAGSAEEEVPRRRERGDTRRRGLHASTLGLRYDAATRDLTWLCAFCARPPHDNHLGDLFGPYPVRTDTAECRALDESTRKRAVVVPSTSGSGSGSGSGSLEAWVHAACAVWAPGVVGVGTRLFGLERALWGACGARCRHCARAGAPLACSARACPARAHLPCAREHRWRLHEEDFRALCPHHAPPS